MRNRQVHLDFHTSGALKVGEKFSKEQNIGVFLGGFCGFLTRENLGQKKRSPAPPSFLCY